MRPVTWESIIEACMDINYKMIGKRIRRYRLSKNITQEEMAFQIGTSPAYICNIEQGKKKASLQKLCEISEVLGVTINDLIYSSAISSQGNKSKEFSDLLSLCTKEDQGLILSNMSSIIQMFIS